MPIPDNLEICHNSVCRKFKVLRSVNYPIKQSWMDHTFIRKIDLVVMFTP